MIAVKVGRNLLCGARTTPFVRFETELWYRSGDGEWALMERLNGWRFINGYISPPSAPAGKVYKPVVRWHSQLLTMLHAEVAGLADEWCRLLPGLRPLKEDVELATDEGCLTEKDMRTQKTLEGYEETKPAATAQTADEIEARIRRNNPAYAKMKEEEERRAAARQ